METSGILRIPVLLNPPCLSVEEFSLSGCIKGCTSSLSCTSIWKSKGKSCICLLAPPQVLADTYQCCLYLMSCPFHCCAFPEKTKVLAERYFPGVGGRMDASWEGSVVFPFWGKIWSGSPPCCSCGEGC